MGPVLQPDSLKLGSCKFNFIINIINITLRSGVAAKPKIIGYNFGEKPKIFIFLFFLMPRVSKLVKLLNVVVYIPMPQ